MLVCLQLVAGLQLGLRPRVHRLLILCQRVTQAVMMVWAQRNLPTGSSGKAFAFNIDLVITLRDGILLRGSAMFSNPFLYTQV
jgi:hypothetical protein